VENNKICKAMCDILSEVGAIGKDEKNQIQKYSFRGIDTVYNELHGLLAKHKVFTIPEVIESKSEERQSKSGGLLIYRILRIKYTFYHEDGSSLSAVVEGEAMDSGDKACNKAMSAAHKYLFLQAFSIPTKEDKDADLDSPQPKARNPKHENKDQDKTENKELINTICSQIMELADSDVKKAPPLLLKFTTFENKEGEVIKGTSKTEDLYTYSIKRLQVLHGKLKKEFENKSVGDENAEPPDEENDSEIPF